MFHSVDQLGGPPINKPQPRGSANDRLTSASAQTGQPAAKKANTNIIPLPVQPADPVQQIEKALNTVAKPLLGENERLSIAQDDPTGRFVYKSFDKGTGELVRQWPAETFLRQLANAISRDNQDRPVEAVAVDQRA